MSYVIELANQLEKVILAKESNDKESYDKESEIYRVLAQKHGVTEEAINYILAEIAGGSHE